MVNQGILKTLEAFIGLFIVLFFLLIFIPQQPMQEVREPIGFLPHLLDDQAFRSCVIREDRVCINSSIQGQLSNQYDFTYNISNTPYVTVEGLPQKQVFSEAIFVAGNITNSSTKILRVFYWAK